MNVGSPRAKLVLCHNSKTRNSLDNHQSPEDTAIDFDHWPNNILVLPGSTSLRMSQEPPSHSWTPFDRLIVEGSVLNPQRTSRDSEAEGPAWQNHSGLRNLDCWFQARWVWHGKGVLSESLALTHCWGWIPGSPALVCPHLCSSCPAAQLSFECMCYMHVP